MLAVNLILAGMLFLREYEAETNRKKETQQLLGLIRQRGINLRQDQLTDTLAYSYDLARDPELERLAAEAVIGRAEAENLGGNLWLYKNERGEARFRFNGLFSITPDIPIEMENAEAQISSLATAMGFYPSDELPELVHTDTGYSVYPRVEGLPLWDGYVDFVIENGSLVSISGRWPVGHSRPVSNILCRSAGSALLALTAGKEGVVPESDRLISLELGFREASAPAGIVRLMPVWRVRLESGEYYVDAYTSEVTEM